MTAGICAQDGLSAAPLWHSLRISRDAAGLTDLFDVSAVWTIDCRAPHADSCPSKLRQISEAGTTTALGSGKMVEPSKTLCGLGGLSLCIASADKTADDAYLETPH